MGRRRREGQRRGKAGRQGYRLAPPVGAAAAAMAANRGCSRSHRRLPAGQWPPTPGY